MAESSRKKVEKSNTILENKKEDIENKQEKVDHEKMQEEIAGHDLEMDRGRLQQNLDSTIRDNQREMENIGRDFQQKMENMNIEHLKNVEDHRKETVEAKEILDDKIEEMSAEMESLTKKIADMDVEIANLNTTHKANKETLEMNINEEFEEKIKQIEEDNEQEIKERDLAVRKLTQEKNSLKNDIDDLNNENENDMIQKSHENQEALENAVDEENKNWRNKMANLQQEKANMERMLTDDITHLETKLRDELLETDGKFKLILEGKQSDMDLMKTKLKKGIEEAKGHGKILKAEMRQKAVDNQNDMKIKLNEKTMNMKEEHMKELNDAVRKETYNLQHQMNLREKNHQFEMEKKATDLAIIVESLTRALARKN